jgi:hypothetical protein
MTFTLKIERDSSPTNHFASAAALEVWNKIQRQKFITEQAGKGNGCWTSGTGLEHAARATILSTRTARKLNLSV